jgi:hypothetical protein
MLLPGFRVSKSIIKTEVYLVQSDKIHSSKWEKALDAIK